jgi:hypothetical protein
MKPIINICLIGTILATSSIASASSLNEQKSKIRNEASITTLNNDLYEKKNRGLELEITNKELEMKKKQTFSKDSTVYLDDLSDPIFGEGLTQEDTMSFGRNGGYGKIQKGGKTASNLNDRDKKARQNSVSANINGQIDPEMLKKQIKEMISNEMATMGNKKNRNDVSFTPSLEDQLELQSENMAPLVMLPSDKGSSTSLVEINVLKMVQFGEKSTARVVAKFKVVNGNRSSLIEDITLDLEEGQIYTYFDKVYLVKTITNNRIVLTNSTDKTEIIQHL